MFKKKDPYSFTKFCTLLNGTDPIGSIFFEYQVTSYDDVQLEDFTSIQKSQNRKFLLHCTQRINIFNPSGMVLSPEKKLDSYDNYPVMINTSISIGPSTSGWDFRLLDYSPQTVNTKIQSSGTSGDSTGQTRGSSTNSTVGSSTSQTNSYGVSVSVGAADMGDFISVSGSVSSNYEHSSTNSYDQSHSIGSDSSSSKSNETSNSAAMSIKDWGAYALINPVNKNPSWTFGQEYPWDAIDCRRTNGAPNPDTKNKNANNQVNIVIPSAMSLRLYDGVSLYPPSQLSMFGVNFVMKAFWLVTIENGTPDEVTIDHVINYFSGSHILTGSTGPVSVYMDKQPSILNVSSDESLSTTINLALMALDPLGLQNKAAIIGFIPNKFIIQPTPATATAAAIPFKIISASNNLMIKDTTTYPSLSASGAGAGFTPSETALTATFSASCTALQMTLYFKVIDTVNDYTLFMKHWNTGAMGVMLTLVINGNTANPITKYVDALEAEGGENNLLSIVLRNQNYASIDYHDYLQLGLNSIQITIQPIGGQFVADCGYQLRAISIEKG